MWLVELGAELSAFFIKHYFSLNELQTSHSYTELVSCRHFLKNEWSVISRKTTRSIYWQWWNLSFHSKNESCEKLYLSSWAWHFPNIQRLFKVRWVVIAINFIFIFHNEMWWFGEEFHGYVNHYFLINLYMSLRNWTWGTNHSKSKRDERILQWMNIRIEFS